nr:hypothetical protein [Tanacetum cinerariifolium]
MENEHELSYETLARIYLGSYEHRKSVGAGVEPLEPGFEFDDQEWIEIKTFSFCTFPTEGMISIISMVSISLEGFLPFILLLVVIIVAVVIVAVILIVVVIDAIVGVVIVVASIGVVVVVMIIGIVVIVD